VFEVHGRLSGDGNEKKHGKESQRQAEQTSLFCSRFFVLLERIKRNSALDFCFFWANPKERRRKRKMIDDRD
jgi:hypothetical protein